MKFFFTLFLSFLTFQLVTSQVTFNDSNLKEKQVLQAVVSLVKTKHIAPKKIDDDFSKKMFKTYIDSLDTNKIFFLQSDIDEFRQYETKLDDQIKNSDFTFFYLTKKRFLQRAAESNAIFEKLVTNKFDFNEKEKYISEKVLGFPKNNDEITKAISKYFKNETFYFSLQNRYDSNLTQKEFADYIQDYANNKLSKKIEASYFNVSNITNDLVFYFYINSFISQFDSHSIYLLPFQFNACKIARRNDSDGYGFEFQIKNNFISVASITAGGPAYKINNLEVGDAILKVGFDNEEQVNAVGYTLVDFFKLLKKKSQLMKLTLKKPNGSIFEVQIKRGIIATKDFYVKSAVVNKNNKKYTVLSFSNFYNELYEGTMRNAVDDFNKELQKLKEANVDGLVLDIRNNSGGSVETAIKIISNFVKQQNIGHFKDISNKSINLVTENEILNWNKHVVLLVNENNQSSAELIASTFKEFQIGIVIGNSTYGNATVKQILDLSTPETTKNLTSEVGAFILTTQKFYNASGKSIQKVGVIPDISFDSKNKVVGEKTLENAINNDFLPDISKQITLKENRFATIIKKSQARLAQNKIYQYIINDKLELDLGKIITLNSVEYKKQYDAILKASGDNPLDNYSNNLVFTPPTESEEKALKKKILIYQKRKEWLQSLSQDFQIEEGINILEDMNNLKK